MLFSVEGGRADPGARSKVNILKLLSPQCQNVRDFVRLPNLAHGTVPPLIWSSCSLERLLLCSRISWVLCMAQPRPDNVTSFPNNCMKKLLTHNTSIITVLHGQHLQEHLSQVAPYGGAKGLLPTNPWAIALPGDSSGPVVIIAVNLMIILAILISSGA